MEKDDDHNAAIEGGNKGSDDDGHARDRLRPGVGYQPSHGNKSGSGIVGEDCPGKRLRKTPPELTSTSGGASSLSPAAAPASATAPATASALESASVPAPTPAQASPLRPQTGKVLLPSRTAFGEGGDDYRIADDSASKEGQSSSVLCDDGIIDLTVDSFDDEDSTPTTTTHLPSAPVACAPLLASDRAVEPCKNEEGVLPSKLSLTPPSPPPSPLPLTMIRDPPPLPGPMPKTFTDVRMHEFLMDYAPIASASLTSRPACIISCDAGFHLDGSGTCLDEARCIDVRERLKTWEPYWKIVEVSSWQDDLSNNRTRRFSNVGFQYHRSQVSMIFHFAEFAISLPPR